MNPPEEDSSLSGEIDSPRPGFGNWCRRNGPWLTKATLAVIFIWFGALKVGGASPAADLVAETFAIFPRGLIVPLLGLVEIAIGILLCFRRTLPWGLGLLALHLPGTFLSFLIVPERCFVRAPFLLTTEGEFILKNLIIISAAITLAGAAVSGAKAVR